MHVTSLISGLIAVVGAVTVWVWMAGRTAAAPAGHQDLPGTAGAYAAIATGAVDA